MSQKGEHTWDLVIQYHRCPVCGYITESRENYTYRMGGKYQKDLECPRCHHLFTLTKLRKPSFGPLIGDPQPKEVSWE
jgi:uncharacterized C2H2 Zn-finger protein